MLLANGVFNSDLGYMFQMSDLIILIKHIIIQAEYQWQALSRL